VAELYQLARSQPDYPACDGLWHHICHECDHRPRATWPLWRQLEGLAEDAITMCLAAGVPTDGLDGGGMPCDLAACDNVCALVAALPGYRPAQDREPPARVLDVRLVEASDTDDQCDETWHTTSGDLVQCQRERGHAGGHTALSTVRDEPAPYVLEVVLP